MLALALTLCFVDEYLTVCISGFPLKALIIGKLKMVVLSRPCDACGKRIGGASAARGFAQMCPWLAAFAHFSPLLGLAL
jgi:hypothetical protein